MAVVCKIMTPDEWESTIGSGKIYQPVLEADLRDGFIHCSTNEQLPTTLSRFYRDAEELMIAIINEPGLTSELKWEPGKLSSDELFPHIYGPIVPEAVAGAHRIHRDSSGDFALPTDLKGA
jgi:uncharacterized protein (DUF952 family)